MDFNEIINVVEESFVNALLNPVSVVAPQVETVEASVEVETELEKVQVETPKEVDLEKLIQTLILFRDGQVALTGFRYADTGNSVVLAKIGASWAVHEFDKSDFSISRRRGAGSFRCVANSLDPKEVFRCIEHYISFGWELIEDEDSENVAGALILKFLPVIRKFMIFIKIKLGNRVSVSQQSREQVQIVIRFMFETFLSMFHYPVR